MARVVLQGDELVGFTVADAAASVRVLLPTDGVLVLPEWNGNEFRLATGARAPIRTLTPRRHDPATGELTVEVVLHGHGRASEWADAVAQGDDALRNAGVAVSGPGRGFDVDRHASGLMLAGDETALPAIAQLLEAAPPSVPMSVYVSAAPGAESYPLPRRAGATIEWLGGDDERPGDGVVRAIARSGLAQLDDRVHLWVAGEAAAVQQIRRHLFEGLGWPRSRATVRGYWKAGRAADDADSTDDSTST